MTIGNYQPLFTKILLRVTTFVRAAFDYLIAMISSWFILSLCSKSLTKTFLLEIKTGSMLSTLFTVYCCMPFLVELFVFFKCSCPSILHFFTLILSSGSYFFGTCRNLQGRVGGVLGEDASCFECM